MNGSYYANPTFPGAGMNEEPERGDSNFLQLPIEENFLENILRLNIGKKVTAYLSFPYSEKWKDKEFKGIIEAVGKNYLIISNPSNGQWHFIFMIYLNYIDFEEKINFS